MTCMQRPYDVVLYNIMQSVLIIVPVLYNRSIMQHFLISPCAATRTSARRALASASSAGAPDAPRRTLPRSTSASSAARRSGASARPPSSPCQASAGMRCTATSVAAESQIGSTSAFHTSRKLKSTPIRHCVPFGCCYTEEALLANVASI